MTELVKILFPICVDIVQQQMFYKELNNWFDLNGYRYNENYRYEWTDTGRYVPDYLWLDPELALIFKLKYNCESI